MVALTQCHEWRPATSVAARLMSLKRRIGALVGCTIANPIMTPPVWADVIPLFDTERNA